MPSCPDEKSLEPSIYVWNTSPYFNDTLPTKADLAEMPKTSRLQAAQEVALAEALEQEASKNKVSRIDVTFDHDRNLWPGHYTGMATDLGGVFHPFWSDRRNKIQQAFTARVAVTTTPASPPPPTHETDVTNLVQLVGTYAKYDAAKGTTTFQLQVRNISDQVIYAPLRLRIAKVASSPAGPTAEILNPDATDGGVPSFDFSKLLGSNLRLEPKSTSEVKKITVHTKVATGLDAGLDFVVIGHVPN